VKKLSHGDKNIHDIRLWVPGSLIVFDQTEMWKQISFPNTEPFVGLGMVVANDGVLRIKVLWGANCKKTLSDYNVALLNDDAVYHIG
jgi:hypothetical protein